MKKNFQRLENMRARIPVIGILGLAFFQSLDVGAELNPSSMSVSNQLGVSGRSGEYLHWFQADTFRYDDYVLVGTNAADLSDATFGMWYVNDRVSGVNWIAKTGSISANRVRFHLTRAEANMPEGSYESIAKIYRVTGADTQEVGTIGRNPVEVMWSADATNYPTASGTTNFTFIVSVTSGGSSTSAVNRVVAGTGLSIPTNAETGVVTASLDVAYADARYLNEGQVGGVTNEMIATNSITGDKIVAGTLSNSDFAASSVTGTTIADGTISNSDLAASSVTGTTIADGTISNADLATSSVTSGSILDGTIAVADVAAATVTTFTQDVQWVTVAGTGIVSVAMSCVTNAAGTIFCTNTVNGPGPSSAGGSGGDVYLASQNVFTARQTLPAMTTTQINYTAGGASVGTGIGNINWSHGGTMGAATYGTISGGNGNSFDNSNGGHSTIGGGFQNSMEGDSRYCVISGGRINLVANASSSDQTSTIGGGYSNWIKNSGNSSILGGSLNLITNTAAMSTPHGSGNAANAIGGGYLNSILESYMASIWGGASNRIAYGNYSVAGGYRANVTNNSAFMFNDGQSQYSSTTSNRFYIGADNGVEIRTVAAHPPAGPNPVMYFFTNTASGNLEFLTRWPNGNIRTNSSSL